MSEIYCDCSLCAICLLSQVGYLSAFLYLLIRAVFPGLYRLVKRSRRSPVRLPLEQRKGDPTIKWFVSEIPLASLDSSMDPGSGPEAPSGPAGNLARRLDGWTRPPKPRSMMRAYLSCARQDNKDEVEIASLAVPRNSAPSLCRPPRISFSFLLSLVSWLLGCALFRSFS